MCCERRALRGAAAAVSEVHAMMTLKDFGQLLCSLPVGPLGDAALDVYERSFRQESGSKRESRAIRLPGRGGADQDPTAEGKAI